MTLPWGLPLDMDQGPQLLSAPHDLPLLATAKLVPNICKFQLEMLELSDITESTWEKRAASLTKAPAAPWLLCPWLLP